MKARKWILHGDRDVKTVVISILNLESSLLFFPSVRLLVPSPFKSDWEPNQQSFLLFTCVIPRKFLWPGNFFVVVEHLTACNFAAVVAACRFNTPPFGPPKGRTIKATGSETIRLEDTWKRF